MDIVYLDNNPFTCQWTENLIKIGEIPNGEVWCRSICDVKPAELAGVRQFHAFNGIAGWSLALSLAGWPQTRPVWTGSCPCQPFSQAGRRRGFADERHLWPIWRGLIAKCRPPTVFGEQVGSPLGRAWLARVRSDLEALGYAVGCADLPACSVGAPHIRQRLWLVADSKSIRRKIKRKVSEWETGPAWSSENGGLAESATKGLQRPLPFQAARNAFHGSGHRNWMGHTGGMGQPGKSRRRPGSQLTDGRSDGGSWDKAVRLIGADGKTRRIESGIMPLAHGVPKRVDKIRAYGNAIVPQLAAAFIKAWMTKDERSIA